MFCDTKFINLREVYQQIKVLKTTLHILWLYIYIYTHTNLAYLKFKAFSK